MPQALCIATTMGVISARYLAFLGNALNIDPTHSSFLFGFVGAAIGLAFGLKIHAWGK